MTSAENSGRGALIGVALFLWPPVKDWFIQFREGKETWQTHVLSAGVATFSVATTTAPLWMIKTRMQLQNSGASGQGFPVYVANNICKRRVLRVTKIPLGPVGHSPLPYPPTATGTACIACPRWCARRASSRSTAA